jgi:hypothetical protein
MSRDEGAEDVQLGVYDPRVGLWRGVSYGAIAAAAWIGVWALLAYTTNLEVGLLGILLAGAVGKLIALGGSRGSRKGQIAAVVIVVAAYPLARFLAFGVTGGFDVYGLMSAELLGAFAQHVVSSTKGVVVAVIGLMPWIAWRSAGHE